MTEFSSEERRSDHLQSILYLFLCIFFWIIIDFGTAGGFRISYFEKYGLALLLFYIGYPIIFTYLTFGLKYSERKLFIATLLGIFIIEGIFTRNTLVIDFPVCLIGIPLAIAVYAPLTYFPLWIVRKEVRAHMGIMLFLSLIELVVIILTTFGSGK